MLIEKIIRKLKGDEQYKWDGVYSSLDLLIIVKGRGLQVLRGLFEKIFFKKSIGLLFIGRNVTIEHARKIRSGKNLIINNSCYINALSINGIVLGDNVSIGRNSTIVCTGVVSSVGVGIKIGSGTGINDLAYLGGQGGIVIGEDVIIGPGVKIFSENHNYSDNEIPIKMQGVTRKEVVIGNNCWIGANAIILAGVTLGDGVVVAAGSVVTKSVPSNSLIAGVPAKFVKFRYEI